MLSKAQGRTMRKGIHRGYKSNADKEPKRAWVAEAPGGAGEWLSEAEYRAGGYSPDFDSLPVLITEILGHGPVDIDALPPEDREYVRKYLERQKAEVLVVFDADFGDRVSAWRGRPVWITMSPANARVVQALWASAPNPTGITGFKHEADVPAEDRLLAEISTIDLHHGPYSSKTPYTALIVIGVQLSDRIRSALSEFGFSSFQHRPDGFMASRSDAEARRIRG
jgi:hypothetical protein